MGDFDSQMEALTNQLERQAERDAERAEAKERRGEPSLSPEERARRAALAERLKALMLVRVSLVRQLEGSRSDRYREQIEGSIAAVDAQIADLES